MKKPGKNWQTFMEKKIDNIASDVSGKKLNVKKGVFIVTSHLLKKKKKKIFKSFCVAGRLRISLERTGFIQFICIYKWYTVQNESTKDIQIN